jgi:hypothetical protein
MRYDSKTKQIAFSSIGFLMFSSIFNHLWSHVAHSSTAFIGHGSDSVVEIERKSEVDDEWLQIGQIYEYVLRFEVSMNYVCLVDIPQTL